MSYPPIEIKNFLCFKEGCRSILDRSYKICPETVSSPQRREYSRQSTRYVAELYARGHYESEDLPWLTEELDKFYSKYL